MVICYLENIKDYFYNQKVDLVNELENSKKKWKENIEIKRVLEENNDPYFEAFTPRTVNEYHKKKIEELDMENHELENNIRDCESKLREIEKELERVTIVIECAKEKEQLLDKLGG